MSLLDAIVGRNEVMHRKVWVDPQLHLFGEITVWVEEQLPGTIDYITMQFIVSGGPEQLKLYFPDVA